MGPLDSQGLSIHVNSVKMGELTPKLWQFSERPTDQWIENYVGLSPCYRMGHPVFRQTHCGPSADVANSLKQAMEEYVTITDDWEGVEIVTNENGKSVSRGKCWDDYFWYAPACRDACQIGLQVFGPEMPN